MPTPRPTILRSARSTPPCTGWAIDGASCSWRRSSPDPRRFNELLDGLDGLAPNILSARLKALEAEGILAARPYSQRPYRVAYVLTARGAELAGALRLLAHWGAQRSSSRARGAAPLHHATCGTAVEARWWCPTCEPRRRRRRGP